MAQSKARTAKAYLAELPKERREVVSKVRAVILKNLPKGYQESMTWGMLSYEIPLERCPDTYNGKPLMYCALAAQKNFYGLYLICGQHPTHRKTLEEGFKKIGKKMDMGRSCLRFKKLEDIPLPVIGKLIARVPPRKLIEIYQTARQSGARCD